MKSDTIHNSMLIIGLFAFFLSLNSNAVANATLPYSLTSFSATLLHDTQSVLNHVILTFEVNWEIDDANYLLIIDINEDEDVDIWNSSTYGRCLVKPDSEVISYKDIPRQGQQSFSNVPCNKTAEGIQIELINTGLIGKQAFQVLVKDITFNFV